jgi:hypothetical protein
MATSILSRNEAGMSWSMGIVSSGADEIFLENGQNSPARKTVFRIRQFPVSFSVQ